MQKLIYGLVVLLVSSGPSFAQESPPAAANVEQGAMMGMADIVRSNGMAQILRAQAGAQGEATRKQYIENQTRAVQGYLDLRRYNRESRNAERHSPLSLEQYVREARQQAPDRLSSSQLDPLTGRIEWPGPLLKSEYEPLRQRLGRVFQDRAMGMPVYGELQDACGLFLAQLKGDLPMFSANDYMRAHRFVESLKSAGSVVEP